MDKLESVDVLGRPKEFALPTILNRMKAMVDDRAKKDLEPALTREMAWRCTAKIANDRMGHDEFERFLLDQIKAGTIAVTNGRFWVRRT